MTSPGCPGLVPTLLAAFLSMLCLSFPDPVQQGFSWLQGVLRLFGETPSGGRGQRAGIQGSTQGKKPTKVRLAPAKVRRGQSGGGLDPGQPEVATKPIGLTHNSVPQSMLLPPPRPPPPPRPVPAARRPRRGDSAQNGTPRPAPPQPNMTTPTRLNATPLCPLPRPKPEIPGGGAPGRRAFN